MCIEFFTYVYHVCALYPQTREEGTGSLELGYDAVSHCVDTGDRAWVLCKSNTSFKLLSYLPAPCPMFTNTSQAGIIIRSDHLSTLPSAASGWASPPLALNLDPEPPDRELPQQQPSRPVWMEAVWQALQMAQRGHTLKLLWSAVKMRPCSTHSIVRSECQSLLLARKKSTWNMRVIIFNWMCLVAVTKINVYLLRLQVQ